MIQRTLFLIIFIQLTTFLLFGQIDPVNVADLTIKVGGMSTEEMYYSFAEGDKIIFSFEEERGKEIKEIEISELPSNSKFMDYKTSKVKNKEIRVLKKAVYKFRFYNSSLWKRICRIQIKRIPENENLKSFNTDWKWKTIYDTTYVPYTKDSLVGYDTLHYKEKVKELVKAQKVDDILFNKNQRVGDKSVMTPRNSYTYLSVKLPQDKIEPYRKEKIISWAYWIGVGKEAQEAYKQNVKNFGKIASTAASTFATPLAGLAVGAVSELIVPKAGDNVHYWFITDHQNAQNFKNGYQFRYFDKGNGKAAYGKNTDRLKGQFFIGLHNDNNIQDIDVNVKVVVIKKIEIYEDKEHDRQKVKPRYVKLHKKKMKVESHEIRAPVE